MAWMMLGGGMLSAETYHRMALRDVAFENGGEVLDAAMENSVSNDAIGSLRFPAEAYLAGMVAEGAEQQSTWKQGHLEVAFRVDDEEILRGWVDLNPEEADGLKGFAFTLDPAAAKGCSKEEFDQVKVAHYVRLRDQRLSGKAWFRHHAGGRPQGRGARWQQRNLASTFGIFSGGRAIAENLALDRELILATGNEADEKSVKVEDIRGVTVKPIDWKDRLPEGEEVTVDVLSRAIPLDQHAVFFPSLGGMLEMVKRIENDGAPMAQVYSVRNPFRTLASKYRAQMGLDLPDAVARLLPVKSVALTGGDPYFPLGSDVAVLFESDKPGLLYQAMLRRIELRAGKQGAMTKEWQQNSVDYSGFETKDRGFSGHVMRCGDVVVVSNSLAQLKRLAQVGDGVPALGASDEFRFFRHRYPAGEGDGAFVFLSDATIRRWAGPELRIGASRRTRALAALSEICSRVVDGAKPGDDYVDLLGEVTVDGRRVRSANFGTPEFLTPVSELGIGAVSVAEKNAYERWRSGYEMGWSQVFDPIALKIDLKEKTGNLDLTVLPLTVGSDYQDMMELVGEAELDAVARTVPKDSILHLAMAVDRKSRLFSNFDQELPGMLPGLKVNPLGWVGESVSLTLEDGFFWKALEEVGMEYDMLLHVPMVVRVGSASRFKLAVFLTGLRAAVESTAPELVEWEVRKHGGKSYVAVSGNEEEMGADLTVYYAALSKALLISLDESVLKRAMERELAEVEEGVVVPLAEARQLLLVTRPGFLMETGSLIENTDLNEHRRRESWRALPVLNDWHRRFPGTDPVVFHREVFGVDLFCPGGRGYRWNNEAMTMESVAYGHPAEPKDESKPLPLIGKFGKMRAGMEFSEGGLRLRLALGPAAGRKNREEPVGKLLATAAELIPQKVGMVTKFEGIGSEGAETMTSRISRVEPEGDSVAIDIEIDYAVDGETYRSAYKNRLKGGLSVYEISDDEGRMVYQTPEVELPSELTEGMSATYPFSGIMTYADDDFDAERNFGEYRFKVTGLETVEVPAGIYKDCVRVEGVSESVMDDMYSVERSVTWYAKGVGAVKWEASSDGEKTVMELVEITGN